MTCVAGTVVVVEEPAGLDDVVLLLLLLPQAASTSAATASPAPTLQAVLSLSLFCIWLSYLPEINDAVGTGTLMSPVERETTAGGTVAHL